MPCTRTAVISSCSFVPLAVSRSNLHSNLRNSRNNRRRLRRSSPFQIEQQVQQQIQQLTKPGPKGPPPTAPGQPPVSAPNNSPLPSITPPNRPSSASRFEGGGALGLAHIGVLEWMEDNRVPSIVSTGTSMGALVGAFYASGLNPDQLRAIASSNAFKTASSPFKAPYADLSYRRRQDSTSFPRPSPSASPRSEPS